MPNWCNNTLTVSVNKERIDINLDREHLAPEDVEETLKQKVEEAHCQLVEFRDRAATGKEGEFFNVFLPVPENATCDDTVEAWGTKWDVCGLTISESPGELGYVFESAWSPPEEFCRRVSMQFPLLSFELVFDEVGMNFYGTYVYFNGECASEEGGDMEFVREEEVQPEEWEEFETLCEWPARPDTNFASWCIETGRYSVYQATKRSRPSSPQETPLAVH